MNASNTRKKSEKIYRKIKIPLRDALNGIIKAKKGLQKVKKGLHEIKKQS